MFQHPDPVLTAGLRVADGFLTGPICKTINIFKGSSGFTGVHPWKRVLRVSSGPFDAHLVVLLRLH
jgi:hypothetical protein